MGLVAVASGVLTLVGGAVSTAAEPPSRILVLRLESRDIPSKLVEMLENAGRKAVVDAFPSATILPSPTLDLASMQLAAGCSDDSAGCLAGIGRAIGATDVLRIALRGSVERLHVSVSLVAAKNAGLVARAFDLVGVDEQSDAEYRWLLARALGARPEPLYGEVVLVARDGADLSDATLFVDDQLVSREGLRRLPVGEHRIEIRRPAFEPAVWMGLVRGGRVTKVSVTLRPRSVARLEGRPAGALARSSTITSGMSAEAAPKAGEPELVVTWFLGAGTLVSSAVWGIWYLRWQDAERSAAREGYQCRTETGPAPDVDTKVCRDGQALVDQTLGIGLVAGALAVSTVVAFVLEDGPALFRSSTKAQVGLAPSRGGGLAVVGWRF